MLSPTLTRLNAIAMVAGTIIGASIFVQPSEIARHLETPLQIMIVWVACGVLTLFGAMVCAELASAFPQTGGVYVFMRDTFSPLAGFLWGWAMFWSMHTGIVAAIAMVFARYTAFFVPAGDRGVRIIAVAVIVALSALNYVGVRAGSRVQTILTGAKVAAIVVLVAIALLLAGDTAAAPAVGQVGVPSGAGFLREFLLAMVAGLFAYGGWHMVTYTAGETRMPATVIPAALVAGVAVVTACYVALNLVYLRCPAARGRPLVHAHRRGCRRCGRRTRRIRDHGGVGDGVVGGRADRHHSHGTAGVLLDGAGRARAEVARPHSSHPPHAVACDRGAGPVGQRAGRHRRVPAGVHARHLHRVALLRADGRRPVRVAPPAGLQPGCTGPGGIPSCRWCSSLCRWRS